VQASLYGNQRNELTKIYSDDTYDVVTTKSRSTSTIAGASLRGSYDFGDYGVLAAALSGENQSWDETGFAAKKKGFDDIDIKQDLQEYSAALEYTVTPIDPVTLVAGAGYVAQTGPESETATDWTYLVGATYRPFEGTAISATHARKVRFASVRNLFDGTSGNPDLEPEVSMHYEIGLDQTLPYKTMFTAAVYRNDVKDLIEKDDTTKLYENYDKYLLQGFELGLENRFFDSFWARVSYNYLHSEDRSDDADREELQYRPRDTVAVEAEYTCPYGAALYASFYYAAHQYTYSGDDRKEMNDIALVNLKLSQAFLDNALKVYAGVNNVFDEDYEESYGFTRPGRTLYCGFDYAF
jgi:outer membrane receptor protein involved in Fe transport